MSRTHKATLAVTVLMALVSSARATEFETLADALDNVSRGRKSISGGTCQAVASSRTSFRDGQPEIGHGRSASIAFGRSVYNCKSTVKTTHGYEPRRTDSAGNVSYGPFEVEDSVYFRSMIGDASDEFLIERSDGKISSVSYIGPTPRHFSLSNDILQLGLVAPQVRFDEEALRSKIRWSDEGIGHLSIKVGDASVTLAFDRAHGGLIHRATTEVNGNKESISIVDFQKVEGHWFPREVELAFQADQSSTKTLIQFGDLSLVSDAKLFVEALPTGMTADGLYTNSMYVIDDHGRPQFVIKKGGAKASTDPWKGWLYVMSLTALFALSATFLARSYLRKRGSS